MCAKLQALSSRIKQASSNGKWREVLSCYSEIIQTSETQLNDPFLFPIVFKSCAKLSWLSQGRCVHASLCKRGFESFVSVGNSIADFYMKCGDLCSATRAFDSMTSRDSVSWNVVVFGFLDHGFEEDGLWWFSKSRVWGFEPNVSTLVLVIHACRSLRCYIDGEKTHSYVIRSGSIWVSSVQNSILSLYAEFDSLFREMVRESKTEPDCVTVTNVLKGCAFDEKGKQLKRMKLLSHGYESNEVALSSLIDAYTSCSLVDDAKTVFESMAYKDVVSCSTMISGLARSGDLTKLFQSSVR
ncbi:Tetratricopeptide repeat (TPR)-like superfamily protein [Raphanus sativus]|nr:Tetratricopeptide repeat (TPR)-like superfamily protein [Raphanus sativus]